MSEIKPVYQWQYSRGGVLNNTWWQDCTEEDLKARDNKPQFNVRIVFETDAVTESLRRNNEALQAKIDSLMLEYCPDEMTPEQIENYAAHQVKVVICNP